MWYKIEGFLTILTESVPNFQLQCIPKYRTTPPRLTMIISNTLSRKTTVTALEIANR